MRLPLSRLPPRFRAAGRGQALPLRITVYLISGLPYLYPMAEVSIGEALKQFLKSSKLKSGVQALQIQDAWEKIMGKTIARYTDKIEIINSTLFISSSVAPLKNELLYQKAKIIERVNEALGEKAITEVVIR